jgi:hypothetical protein
MHVSRRALLAALALTGAALVHASPAATPAGPHVAGNRIVGGDGRTLVLRGLNRAGTEGGPSSSNIPVTDSEVGWMTKDHPGSWQSSAIRVAVGEAQWTGSCPGLSSDAASYRAKIDAEIRSITRRGVVALVDLHTSTAGCRSIARHAMPDSPVAQQFWSGAAKHYAPNRLVAFELYNEPHFVSEQVWRNGTPSATFQDCDPAASRAALSVCKATQPRYRAVGMTELDGIVAKAAPGHVIVVDGLRWGSQPPATPLAGRVVYGVHPYTCGAPGTCTAGSSGHANLDVLRSWVPLSRRAPIWVTEFGYPSRTRSGDVDASGYYTQTIQFLDAQTPAWGWLAFAFDGGSTGAFALLQNTSSYAPNATGTPVWQALRRQP